jgi:hypothetical protein
MSVKNMGKHRVIITLLVHYKRKSTLACIKLRKEQWVNTVFCAGYVISKQGKSEKYGQPKASRIDPNVELTEMEVGDYLEDSRSTEYKYQNVT